MSYHDHDQAKAAAIYFQMSNAEHRRTDKIFFWLMIVQWIGGIVLAIVVAPYAWSGSTQLLHPHIYAAIFLGGFLGSLPIYLILTKPGSVLTRQTVAISQIGFSALLIHLTGGRIETHFHIFGSLAFLAMYCDWRVIMTASIFTAIDHYARGEWFPNSVYGLTGNVSWRWLEHTGWVLFEDVFLVYSSHHRLKQLKIIADKQARLEGENDRIEQEVEKRTDELINEKNIVKASKERLKLIVDSALDAVVLMNSEKEITSWNPKAEKIFGWKKEEAIGKSLKELISVSSDHRFDDAFHFSHGTKTNKTEVILKTITGTEFQAEIAMAKVVHEGLPIYMAFIRDIRDQKLAEQKIQEQIAYTRLIIRGSPSLICGILPDGKINFINRTAEMVTGYSSEELLGSNFWKTLYPNEKEKNALEFDERLSQGPVYDFETPIQTKDGTERIIAWSSLSRGNESGRQIEIILFGLDLTQRKKDEQKLKAQQAQIMVASRLASLGELAGGVAHEINNPLAILNGRLEELRDNLIDKSSGQNPEENLKIIDSMEGTIFRISSIIKGLSTFSRDVSQEPFVKVKLENILNESLSFMQPKLKRNQIDLKIPENLSEVELECRPVQISQILVNLISNSSDAISSLAEKWIEIRVKDSKDFVEVFVIDSGDKISPNIVQKMMDPFFTTKDVGKGTGLGLSICRGITESHRGSLAYDASFDHTCFKIHLPKLQPKARQTAA